VATFDSVFAASVGVGASVVAAGASVTLGASVTTVVAGVPPHALKTNDSTTINGISHLIVRIGVPPPEKIEFMKLANTLEK
jgi:hypothetical protein